MKKKLKYCSWGIANSYDNFIEINIALKDNKYLRDYIVKHEIGHDNHYDLIHEFKDINLKMFFPMMWFIITHPKTWVDFSPIQYKYNTWVFDANLTTLYSFTIILLVIAKLVFF